MITRTVPISHIDVGTGRRAVSRPAVKELAASISEVGLLSPIAVYPVGDAYELVAGRHRVEAAKSLGWTDIEAVLVDLDGLQREMAEIDENLVRCQLNAADTARQTARRKELYLRMHPETAHVSLRGGPGRGNKTTAESAVVSFATDTAQKTGASERTVRQDVQIGESIPADVFEAIAETPLADSKTDLLNLARLPEEHQREVVRTADLSNKQAVRTAIAERQGFICRTCGQEQTVKVWHCDGCGEHWLPGDPCGDCPPTRPHADDEPCDADIAEITLKPTVDAFFTAIRESLTRDEIQSLITHLITMTSETPDRH